MKITKARLVKIIKEELENLEEKSLRDRLSGYFGVKGSAEKYEQTPEQARDELETRAGELGSAVDKLSKKDRMVANAAVADATADAADMDSKLEDELEDEMIARDEIVWKKDDFWGYEVPAEIPGVDLSRFDLDSYYTEDQIKQLSDNLKRDRLEWLSRFHSLNPDIIKAIKP